MSDERMAAQDGLSWWLADEVVPPAICNVHSVTREFLGVSVADPSPLEPFSWLIPAHAYQCEPPILEPGHAAIKVAGEGWELVADYRGMTVYRTETGEGQVWDMLGDLPDGYTGEAPMTEFDRWQDDKWTFDEAASRGALRNRSARKKLLLTQFSANMIATLQNAVDLQIATEAEIAALRSWKIYGVELNRVDIVEEPPLDNEWPTSPNDALTAAWLVAQGFDETAPQIPA
ncbi:tail fiber assembly protein [Pseudomonas mediterranea]|uniref:tail fiber assembly protein n=1 Tax=Pseudomonas mediterranea TaxID=183795 RepID=UPI003BF4E355